jgi:hypothetical protein
MIVYFVQRGRWAGYWRRVPLQCRVVNLRARLTARGHMVTEVV